MYTRYYDGYSRRSMQPNDNDTSAAPEPESVAQEEECQNPESKEIRTAGAPAEQNAAEVASVLPFNLPGNMKTDDLILLAVLFLILSDSNDEIILPLILGFLFISNM